MRTLSSGTGLFAADKIQWLFVLEIHSKSTIYYSIFQLTLSILTVQKNKVLFYRTFVMSEFEQTSSEPSEAPFYFSDSEEV